MQEGECETCRLRSLRSRKAAYTALARGMGV
jgi:hypothetical protein